MVRGRPRCGGAGWWGAAACLAGAPPGSQAPGRSRERAAVPFQQNGNGGGCVWCLSEWC